MLAIEHSCLLLNTEFHVSNKYYVSFSSNNFHFSFYASLVFVVQDSVEGVVAVATYFPFSRLIVSVPALAMYQLLTFIRVWIIHGEFYQINKQT